MKQKRIMKTYSNYLLVFLLISLLSCKNIDDFEPFKSNSMAYSSQVVSGHLDPINNTSYQFEIDPAIDSKLIFPDGSLIIFYANTLTDGSGHLACSKVKVKVNLIRTKSEMIVNGISTNAIQDRILISGGMVNIIATCNGKELKLVDGKKCNLKLKLDSKKWNPNFEMFYGERAANNDIYWSEADNNPNQVGNVNKSEWDIDSNRSVFGIECFPEKLGWVNCDYFLKLSGADLAKVCIEIVTIPANDQIFIMPICVLDDLNIASFPCCIDAEQKQVCFNNLPKGKKAKYVVVGKGNSDFYFGILESSIVDTKIHEVRLEKKSIDEIKELLAKL